MTGEMEDHTPVGAALIALRAGSPGDVARAVGLLQGAAREGEAEAVCRLAALTGAGVGVPQDWEGAFDLLVQAAVGGSAGARGQLQALAGREAGPDAGPDVWRDLRRSVRLQDWTAPSEKRPLNAAPRVVAVSRFLPPAICNWLIGLAVCRLAPAMVYSRGDAAPVVSVARRNSAFEFAFVDCDLIVHLTRARIAATIGVPAQVLESSQILNYQVGEAFAPHHDFLDPANSAHAADIIARGQRIVTFLVYLNDDFDGAETAFPRLGLNHRGKTGDALYFSNLDGAGGVDRRTLHAGLAPTRGEKWVFSQWIRNLARI